MKAFMNNFNVWIKYEDEKQLAEEFEKALINSGFHIVNKCEHYFDIQGYTGLWLLSESHFAIHSFPEEDKIYIELTSCVDKPFEKMKEYIFKNKVRVTHISKENFVKEKYHMQTEIIMASANKGKIKEAQEILSGYKIIPMKELGLNIDVEEDKETFEENAIKKAEIISRKLNGKMCLADDSGIEIEYLNGFPGVQTKRWLDGTDRERNLAIIEKMKNVPKENRKIKFVTAIAISDGNNTISAVGFMEGIVAENVRGDNGFGFDEIFELKDGRTLAQLNQEEKNAISSRKKALENLKDKLKYKNYNKN